MKTGWLSSLKIFVEKKPLVILRFHGDEWETLRLSRRGANEFTIARPHESMKGVSVPIPCLIIGEDDNNRSILFGLISSCAAITTLESRIKIKKASPIKPSSQIDLQKLIRLKPHSQNLKKKFDSLSPIIALSPKLSSHLIEKLASVKENHGAMRIVEASLSTPRTYKGIKGLQKDAVATALDVFGLKSDDQATTLELVKGRETILDQISLREDTVIEHDARKVPGYNLTKSYMTGRAVFNKGDEQLEVYTANRGKLEEAFGVDLIYLNVTQQSIVMLQYKMLEHYEKDGATDWIYRPDKKLKEQIARMKKFTKSHSPGPYEYRLNPTVFYLKFVKRGGAMNNGSLITPVDHYTQLVKDPSCQGPKGGIIISYQSLEGRYMRQAAFIDLLKAGYIGAHATTTKHLKVLVDAVLKDQRAAVAVIHSKSIVSA